VNDKCFGGDAFVDYVNALHEKMNVASVSAIARFHPIVMALITVVNGDNVATHIGLHAGGMTMETLDAATVSLSAILKSCWVGSEVF